MRFLLLLLSLLLPLALGAQTALSPQTKEALQKLDAAIEKKALFRAEQEAAIERVKRTAEQRRGKPRVDALKSVLRYYTHVQTDSAWRYLSLLCRLPEARTDAALGNYLHIATAEVMAVKGLYHEAQQSLARVDRAHFPPALARYYYHTARSLYGWMSEYTSEPSAAQYWERMTQLYRDSILTVEGAGVGRDIVLADDALTKGDIARARALLEQSRHEAKPTELGYVYNILAKLCAQTGERSQEIYYLALTAQLDLERGITEYEALTRLAQAMYEEDDIERAYAYLRCALEDAAYCKTNLRALESSNIFPIIDKAYGEREAQRRQMQRLFTLVVILLAVVLAVALFYLRNRVRHLHSARQHLSAAMREVQSVNERLSHTMGDLRAANTQLQTANGDLQLTGRMKDEYIARYLERCRAYLDEMQDYRFSIAKMLKNKEYAALAARLKTDSRMTDEQASFYADFDEAFLHLFPHFIESFNALLRPDSRIVPKREGSLTTELRIFALIRLGVQDTATIAHFLNNSLATIYNYRSRIRNMSLAGKDHFEELVMKL